MIASVIERMTTSPQRTSQTLSLQDLRSGGWFPEVAPARRSISSIFVTPNTALALPAYFAAMRAISEDVARMPFLTFRRLAPGKEQAPEHPAFALLMRRPNEEMPAMSFRELLNSWALGWGNGWAEIERDGRGVPRNLWPIHPSRMAVTRDPSERRELRFTVHNDDGTITEFRGVDIFNLHGLGGDGIIGYSIARIGLESIGLALAAQTYGAAFFGNSTRGSGALVHPGKLSVDARGALREQWTQQYVGPENAHKPMILQEGMKWEPFSIPPEEAQFLETRHLQVEEMARWFRITPHKLQHLLRATFSNVESLSIEYVNETLSPWCTRWEQEADRRLFTEAEQRVFFTDHDMRALLKGDLNARSEFNARMFQVGAMSQNDIREAEGMNPIPNGDVYYVPVNMRRSEDAAAGRMGEEEPAGDVNEPEASTADAEERAAMLERVREGYTAVFASAVRQVLNREEKATQRAAKRLAGKREEFASWAGKFFAEEPEHWTRVLAPLCRAYAQTIGAPEDLEALEAFALDATRTNLAYVLAECPLAPAGAEDMLTRRLLWRLLKTRPEPASRGAAE